MDPVIPLPGVSALAAQRCGWFRMSERGRRCAHGRCGRRRFEGWPGKTRIRLHCSRREQHHERDQSNGRDSRYNVDP